LITPIETIKHKGVRKVVRRTNKILIPSTPKTRLKNAPLLRMEILLSKTNWKFESE